MLDGVNLTNVNRPYANFAQQIPAELLSTDNLVLPPQLGSATRETRKALGVWALENPTDVFSGKYPHDRLA